ncbi:MAG: signal peptidase I [Candidatus Omnitrophota bacterium]
MDKEKLRIFIKEWVEPILIAIILALIIRTFFMQAFKIPSGSMRLTLQEGDRILVNKLIYRFKDPQTGDIVVFKYPEDPKKDFIKRLIAKEGETVQIKEGDIYIDGELIKLPAIKNITYVNSGSLNDENSSVTVPEGTYFVLGDNSANSRDSRYWGFVPKKNMIGKAFVIYWPITRWQLTK